MAKRVQSPSSINTYKQCPRKYYYQYVKKLPIRENIHLIRGKLAHSVLEKFYEIDPKQLTEENYIEEMTYFLKNLFNAHWNKSKNRIISLGLTEDQIIFYYQETILMIANWLNSIFERMRKKLGSKPVPEIFEEIKPDTIEESMKSEKYQVRGFIDYIELLGEDVKIMDFKTSKKAEMSPQYKLQLAIYALMYDEKYGKTPKTVGLWFLKHGEMTIDVDEELLNLAKFEIEQIHSATETDNILDYKRQESGLCRYSTGQCDFYEYCMKDKKFEEIKRNQKLNDF